MCVSIVYARAHWVCAASTALRAIYCAASTALRALYCAASTALRAIYCAASTALRAIRCARATCIHNEPHVTRSIHRLNIEQDKIINHDDKIMIFLRNPVLD